MQFKNIPKHIVLAPGRINIIGEHTDYNYGLSIPAAIDYWICVGLSENKINASNIYSLNYEQIIQIASSEKVDSDASWARLVNHIIQTIKNKYKITSEFDIVIGGNIPIGCGLSSSTAFVISLTSILLKHFSIDIDKKELAYFCQMIENKAFGMDGGLLDQFGIILSKKNNCMLIDFQDNIIEYIPVLMQDSSWIVINSHIQRELSDSAYIDRIDECKKGIDILKNIYNISSFREITLEMLEILRKKNTLYHNRLSHYVNENQRVLGMKKYLQNGNIKKIGKILSDSHNSLRDLYEVSCVQIDYIIEISKDFKGWNGGRIMGGGFGGSTIHIVENDKMQEYQGYVLDNYTDRFGISPDFIPVTFSNGIEHI